MMERQLSVCTVQVEFEREELEHILVMLLLVLRLVLMLVLMLVLPLSAAHSGALGMILLLVWQSW
jgi:hypothetical protein